MTILMTLVSNVGFFLVGGFVVYSIMQMDKIRTEAKNNTTTTRFILKDEANKEIELVNKRLDAMEMDLDNFPTIEEIVTQVMSAKIPVTSLPPELKEQLANAMGGQQQPQQPPIQAPITPSEMAKNKTYIG